MEPFTPLTSVTELAAALLQGTVAAGLALLSGWLAARYHRNFLRWWVAAWGLYLLRILCIILFLGTVDWSWLYLHQVITGWTAVALLAAALAWSGRPLPRPWFVVAVLFPPLWSWIAIYELEHFFWAALPAVLFLSGATLWTGVVFLTHRRRTGRSAGATALAVTFVLWALHHLDYPLLRARGAWTPWGYYLDILFLLGAGAGILLLVIDEQRGGLERLSQRMLTQHEEERRRLSRELHDETAQVLSAVKMQLGVLAESLGAEERGRLARAQTLLDDGIRGIRSVTDALRPSLLDDLGLVPALRSLGESFATRGVFTVSFDADAALPTLDDATELALFRALQEGLSNVARHAEATRATVKLRIDGATVTLTLTDDGKGPGEPDPARLEREGHMGLAGMRERIEGLGGSVELRSTSPGAALVIKVPAL
jgi:signal transduction histidine kinase